MPYESPPPIGGETRLTPIEEKLRVTAEGGGQERVKELQLTEVELRVLLFAAQSIAEDIDSYGLTGPEKAAYVRVLDKLGAAYQGVQVA